MAQESTPRTARRLVELVAECERAGGVAELSARLRRDWPVARLLDVLAVAPVDAARCAALCLGVIGGMQTCPALVTGLHHSDAGVAREAEHALWSIWFRSGGVVAQAALVSAARQLAPNFARAAVDDITYLLRHFPVYAEAYHQRAAALLSLGRIEEAGADFRRAAHLNRCHFAALAGQGHCHVHAGRVRDALQAYVAARDIHPRLEGVRQTIRRLRNPSEAVNVAPMLRYVDAADFSEPLGSIARR